MSDIRQDPLTGRIVIVAKDRAGRPDEFRPAAMNKVEMECPFCAGNEHHTPDQLAVYPRGGGPDGDWSNWQVRVVPNKYPAVYLNGKPRKKSSDDPCLLFRSIDGGGRHEVIIESNQHVASLTDLSNEQAEMVVTAYRDRLAAARRSRSLKHAMVFKNMGYEAGASLEHAHSQFIALPFTPPSIRTQLSNCREYYQQTARRLLADMIAEESAGQTRLVSETEHFIAFCPFASRFAYECWIVPKFASANFDALHGELLGELARMMRDLIDRIERLLNRPAYNFTIHTAPFDADPANHYDWHIEIFPRTTKVAGFEWGAESYINAVPPEDAAAELRGV